ncbi:thioredoxin family protein [Patescibacteria group bacterium]|nr:thioredoxin family protein [Patescibacteria group bacterium]
MNKVTVYSTPTCPYCLQAKAYFKENNVEFKDIDVAADEKKAEEMIHKSGQMGVPVIIIEKDGKEEVVVGFEKEKIAGLLSL